MAPTKILLALASLYQHIGQASAQTAAGNSYSVSSSPPSSIAASLPEAFVSFSIELCFFPDYAGNLASPNTFSDNLLNNIGNLTGTKPYIRVGGNTQDRTSYDSSQTQGIINVYSNPSDDQPVTVKLGPAFFESYQTWPGAKFTHGFNLRGGADSNAQAAAKACQVFQKTGNLLWWEEGNEPDLYGWNSDTYVKEWLAGTRAIKSSIASACPSMAVSPNYGYIAPSLAHATSSYSTFTATSAFQNGLNADKDISLLSMHVYMGNAESSGVRLQTTLLNHQKTTSVMADYVNQMKALASTGIPYILGEANSLFHQGKPGLSNSLGAALWGVDFNLWCASVGIRRVHMHQGTSYRYASWQPIQTSKVSIGTKAPYYGNIAVAAMLGNLVTDNVQILNIALPDTNEAAYAAYVNKKLARILVINMDEYNSTAGGVSGARPNTVPRPSRTYSFSLGETSGSAQIQRLMAAGSDAITGITWDGWSYNYELNNGKPVRLQNVTVGETAQISSGVVSVSVPSSSVAMLNF